MVPGCDEADAKQSKSSTNKKTNRNAAGQHDKGQQDCPKEQRSLFTLDFMENDFLPPPILSRPEESHATGSTISNSAGPVSSPADAAADERFDQLFAMVRTLAEHVAKPGKSNKASRRHEMSDSDDSGPEVDAYGESDDSDEENREDLDPLTQLRSILTTKEDTQQVTPFE